MRIPFGLAGRTIAGPPECRLVPSLESVRGEVYDQPAHGVSNPDVRICGYEGKPLCPKRPAVARDGPHVRRGEVLLRGESVRVWLAILPAVNREAVAKVFRDLVLGRNGNSVGEAMPGDRVFQVRVGGHRNLVAGFFDKKHPPLFRR